MAANVHHNVGRASAHHRNPDHERSAGHKIPARLAAQDRLHLSSRYSPGRENRRGDEQEKVDEYESVQTILRCVIVEPERLGYQVFWREPGERYWLRGISQTSTPLGVPEFGIELALDEVYAGIGFD